MSVDRVMRQKVVAIEGMMLQLPQVAMPPKHYFADGLYAREIIIPPSTLLTGAIHKQSQLNVLSKGVISVLTEEGVRLIQSPFTIVSPAGTKRIAYAFTECVWTTILATDEADPDEIELKLTAKTEVEYYAYCEQILLGSKWPS